MLESGYEAFIVDTFPKNKIDRKYNANITTIPKGYGKNYCFNRKNIAHIYYDKTIPQKGVF